MSRYWPRIGSNPRTLFGPAVLALAVVGLAGCAGYKEKEFTADDQCQDCGDKGGLFSGDDGAIAVYGESDRNDD